VCITFLTFTILSVMQCSWRFCRYLFLKKTIVFRHQRTSISSLKNWNLLLSNRKKLYHSKVWTTNLESCSISDLIKKTLLINSKRFIILHIWAASWQNHHNGFATSMAPDQPAHPRSLIKIHAVRLPTLLQVEKLIANSMDPDQTARMRRLV
jgi:hypothetical protein